MLSEPSFCDFFLGTFGCHCFSCQQLLHFTTFSYTFFCPFSLKLLITFRTKF